MDTLLILLLLLIGLILIILEILILPGLLTGILGGMLIMTSIILAFTTRGVTSGIITIIISISSLIVILILVQQLKIWDKFVLRAMHKKEEGFISSTIDSNLINETGIALTDLRPSGFVLVKNKKLEAISEGQFISKNSKIQIISIEGSKITVKKIEE